MLLTHIKIKANYRQGFINFDFKGLILSIGSRMVRYPDSKIFNAMANKKKVTVICAQT